MKKRVVVVALLLCNALYPADNNSQLLSVAPQSVEETSENKNALEKIKALFKGDCLITVSTEPWGAFKVCGTLKGGRVQRSYYFDEDGHEEVF